MDYKNQRNLCIWGKSFPADYADERRKISENLRYLREIFSHFNCVKIDKSMDYKISENLRHLRGTFIPIV